MQFDHHTVVLLILRPDAPSMTEEQAAALQDAHMAHTADMIDQGHLLAAGPPVGADDERVRGISVWAVDPDTARELCAQDPAVRAGRLAPQVATWMTPAGQVRFERVPVPRSMTEATEATGD